MCLESSYRLTVLRAATSFTVGQPLQVSHVSPFGDHLQVSPFRDHLQDSPFGEQLQDSLSGEQLQVSPFGEQLQVLLLDSIYKFHHLDSSKDGSIFKLRNIRMRIV